MRPDSPSARPPRRLRPRVPPFYPVPIPARRDGWIMARQAHFLGILAQTGSVAGACEAVGMSRKSAYRLRSLPGAESFAAAWDAALGAPIRKVTVGDLNFLAYEGLVHLRFFRRSYRGWHQVTDDAALFRLIDKLDRMTGGIA